MEKYNLHIKEILIVDDDEPILTFLSTYIEATFTDIKVLKAYDGLKALDIIERTPSLKIVITDLKMPGLNGLKLLSKIKDINDDIEVIILTGAYDESAILEALKFGAIDFLKKPIDFPIAKDSIIKACEKVKMKDILNFTLEELKEQKEKLSKANKTISDMNSNLQNKVEEQVKKIMDNEIAVGYGELIQGIIHNINTPLSTINGGIDILRMAITKDKKNNKSNHDYYLDRIEKIKGAVKNVISIIRSTMQRSRDENSVEKINLDINRLLKQELDFFEANMFYKHQIKKEIIFADDLPSIKTIYSDISQIVINLIQNSLDAMWNSEIKELTVRTNLERDNIAIYISDTGCGIEHKNLDKIYDIFYTTKNSIEKTEVADRPIGNGLGMHTVIVIAKKYNIKIEVTSEVDKGTIFKLSIPIKENN